MIRSRPPRKTRRRILGADTFMDILAPEGYIMAYPNQVFLYLTILLQFFQFSAALFVHAMEAASVVRLVFVW